MSDGNEGGGWEYEGSGWERETEGQREEMGGQDGCKYMVEDWAEVVVGAGIE